MEEALALTGGAQCQREEEEKKKKGARGSAGLACWAGLVSRGGGRKWAKPNWGGERGSGCGLLYFF